VKKQQAIVAASGIIILIIFYFFGNTVPTLKKSPATPENEGQSLDIKTILNANKAKLSPEDLAYVNRLESAVVRGDVKNQQVAVYHQLSNFWRDSVQNGFLPSAYYTAEAAKLENSEKKSHFCSPIIFEQPKRSG